MSYLFDASFSHGFPLYAFGGVWGFLVCKGFCVLRVFGFILRYLNALPKRALPGQIGAALPNRQKTDDSPHAFLNIRLTKAPSISDIGDPFHLRFWDK